MSRVVLRSKYPDIERPNHDDEKGFTWKCPKCKTGTLEVIASMRSRSKKFWRLRCDAKT